MRKNIEISISKKFANYCFVVCFLLLVYITYSFVAQYSNRNNHLVLKGSSELLLAHKQLEDSIKTAEIVVQNIIKEIKGKTDNKNYVSKVLKKYRVLYESDELETILSVSMFSWADKNNKIIINSKYGVLEDPRDISDRNYVEFFAKNPGKVYVGKPVFGAVSRQYIIPFGAGVVDKNGVYQGAVVAGINVQAMYKRIIDSDSIDNASLTILYDKYEDVIFGSNKISKKFLNKINLDDRNVQIIKDFSFFLFGKSIIYKNIKGTDYGIMMTLDSNYDDNSFLKQNYLIPAISVVFIFSFLIFFFRESFIAPIDRLSKLVKDISEGYTDIEIPASNIKEINDLSDALSDLKDFIRIEKYLKSELDKAVRSKTNLIKATSHDLKNYVSGVDGLVDMVIENDLSKKENKEENIRLLKTVSAQIKELKYFVEDLLDTNQTRLQDSILEQVEEIDLEEIINRILVLNKDLILKNKTEVSFKVQDNLPKFHGDVRRIKQIFNNLVNNAVKYSEKYSSIWINIDFSSTDNEFCVSIRDEGIGMSEEEIKLALKGDGALIDKSDLDKEIDSHGVGMLIIKNLVDLHKGRIQIESLKGHGSTFKVFLPVFANKSQKKKIVSGSNKLDKNVIDNLKGKRILLAEDDPVSMMVLNKRINSKYKMESELATNGEELIESYKNIVKNNRKIDCVVTDINMPKLDGIEATRRIRKFEKENGLKRVPIIVYCGNDNRDILDEIKKSGVDNIFIKGEKGLFELLECISNLDPNS